MRFRKISEVIQEAEENDLFKVYLAVKRESGHRWWTYKGFAGDNFFIQVTEENIDTIELNPSYPILNYSNDIIKQLLQEKRIQKDNIINRPEDIIQSGSKKEFHQNMGEDENLPSTVFKQSQAKAIGFPMIAKPTDGHSGLGIQVFKTEEDFDKADHAKLDLYSEFVDKKAEHRFFNYNCEPFFWMERKPLNAKAKSGDGKGDEEMNFQYIKKDVNKIPKDYLQVIEKFCKKMIDLPYICFDIMEDQQGKIYIIESNSQPGVPFDSTIEIYKVIFEDFYGRPVNTKALTKLDALAKTMNAKTLAKDNGRFKIEL